MSIEGEAEDEPKGFRQLQIPGESVEFRIQAVLAHKEQTAEEWSEQQRGDTTAYLTDGSVWSERVEEDADSTEKVTKYLIKWHGLSYMHVSWESEAALLQRLPNFKMYLKKYQDKLKNGQDIFDDLSLGEHFPATFLQVSTTSGASTNKSMEMQCFARGICASIIVAHLRLLCCCCVARCLDARWTESSKSERTCSLC